MIEATVIFLEDELQVNGFRMYQEDDYTWIVHLKNGNTKGFETQEQAVKFCMEQ